MAGRSLPEGKLPIDVLAPVLKSISRGNLVVGPDVGLDVGITRCHGRYIVSSSDPITGTEKRMGWHAVNVSANDVATSGIMPDTLNVVALLPKGTKVEEIKHLMTEINRTAGALNIAVAGGHTEITPNLKKRIVMVTAIGSGNKFVTSAGGKAGDSILMTKTAGIEGTSILAGMGKTRKLVTKEVIGSAKKLIGKISIVEEAKAAFATGRIHAMHDITEGGALGSVTEMSLASELGFELFKDLIPVHPSTRIICDALSLDPLKLLGSGSLLISCPEDAESRVAGVLKAKKIRCTKIGRFVPLARGRVVISSRGRAKLEETSVQDELWIALRKYG